MRNAVAWVMKHSPARGSERLVLLAVASHFVPTKPHDCFPGIDLIASEAGVSRSTVLRTLAALEVKGELAVERRDGPGRNPRRRPNRYSLPGFMEQFQRCHGDTSDTNQRCQIGDSEVSKQQVQRCHQVTPELKESFQEGAAVRLLGPPDLSGARAALAKARAS